MCLMCLFYTYQEKFNNLNKNIDVFVKILVIINIISFCTRRLFLLNEIVKHAF